MKNLTIVKLIECATDDQNLDTSNHSTKLAKRFYHFINKSGLHGVRYLDRRYALIDR